MGCHGSSAAPCRQRILGITARLFPMSQPVGGRSLCPVVGDGHAGKDTSVAGPLGRRHNHGENHRGKARAEGAVLEGGESRCRVAERREVIPAQPASLRRAPLPFQAMLRLRPRGIHMHRNSNMWAATFSPSPDREQACCIGSWATAPVHESILETAPPLGEFHCCVKLLRRVGNGRAERIRLINGFGMGMTSEVAEKLFPRKGTDLSG